MKKITQQNDELVKLFQTRKLTGPHSALVKLHTLYFELIGNCFNVHILTLYSTEMDLKKSGKMWNVIEEFRVVSNCGNLK
jgi:hypothetical protein